MNSEKRIRLRKDNIKRSTGEKVIYSIMFTIFALYSLSMLYMLFWMITNSFKPFVEYNLDLANGKAFDLPNTWRFQNYIDVFKMIRTPGGITLLDMIWNNIWQFLLPLPISIVISTWYPYVISRFKFKGRRIIYAVVMFRMIIPIVGTGGAWFKLYHDLGLYNNPLFFVVGALGSGGTTFLLYYGFFKNLPHEYAEAVYIDGGGEFTVFFKIMLPQAIPMITVLLINSFIASWNDAMTTLLYMPSYLTISAGMYSVQNTLLRTGKTSIYYAGLVTAMIPMLVVFLLFSNKMMTSLSVGGLKG